MTSPSFCGSCGNVLKDGSLYCGSCGATAPQGRTATPVPPPTMVGTVGGSWPAPPPYANQSAAAGAPTYASAPMPAPPGWMPVDPGIYAGFGRRVGAYFIDAIPPILIYFVGFGAFLAAFSSRSSRGVSVSLILFVVLPPVYFVVLWAMAAKGSSPGKAMLGIRVVRESSGAFPGAGLGLGRLLLMGLLISVTLYIGGFSPLWDASGRRKGWWDSAVGTVVLNLSALQGYRAGARNPAQSVGPGAPVASSVMSSQLQAPPMSWVAPTEPPPPMSNVPEWDLPPARAASGTGKVPAASWSDRPAESLPPPPPPPPPPAPQPQALPGAEGTEQYTLIAPADHVPWGAAAPPAPGVISAIPGLTPVGDSDSFERTRMAQVRSPKAAGTGWELQFDDGRTLLLGDGLIIGRDPSAAAAESGVKLLALGDEGRSVSKTHLRLDVGAAGVQVTDRHSTNGVTVITAGVPLDCVPGVPTVVPGDSVVRFGDRHLVVHQI